MYYGICYDQQLSALWSGFGLLLQYGAAVDLGTDSTSSISGSYGHGGSRTNHDPKP